MAQADAVEFAEDEVAQGIGPQAFDDDRIGDAALDVVVDAEVEIGEEAGSADEDEIVIFGEVFEEEPKLAEVAEVHEVGVVEDGGEAFAGVVEAEGLFDEFAFALKGGRFELDTESIAQNFYRIGVGVQSARDGGDEVLIVGEALQRLLEDRLAGARNAEDEAEPALLAMNFERVVDFLLVRQQHEFAEVEGVLGEAVEGSDHHGCSLRRASPLATASRSRAAPMRWPL